MKCAAEAEADRLAHELDGQRKALRTGSGDTRCPLAMRPALARLGVRHGLASAGPDLRTHGERAGWEMKLLVEPSWEGRWGRSREKF